MLYGGKIALQKSPNQINRSGNMQFSKEDAVVLRLVGVALDP